MRERESLNDELRQLDSLGLNGSAPSGDTRHGLGGVATSAICLKSSELHAAYTSSDAGVCVFFLLSCFDVFCRGVFAVCFERGFEA